MRWLHSACGLCQAYLGVSHHAGHEMCLQVICHGIPDKRPLEDGDIVNVDISAYYEGYHADLNETYTVGQVDAKSKRLIKAAYDVSRHSWSACLHCPLTPYYCIEF